MSAAAAAAATAAISSSYYSSSSNSYSNDYHHHQLNYQNFGISPSFHSNYKLYKASHFYDNGTAPGVSASVKRMISTPATVESEPVLDSNTKFLEEEKVTFAVQNQTPRRKKEKSKVLRWWKAIRGCLIVLRRRNA